MKTEFKAGDTVVTDDKGTTNTNEAKARDIVKLVKKLYSDDSLNHYDLEKLILTILNE